MLLPEVSIIVPVYNAEAYLEKCINSILAQCFKDFELLLIDDGSKDKSGEICDKYASLDNRIQVFHKQNNGVSSARNIGLDRAKGKWITFIDSDDWIDNTYLDSFLKQSDEVNLIISGCRCFGDNLKSINLQEVSINIENELYDIWKKHYYSGDFIYWYPWGKFYKNSIIQKNKLRFVEKMIYSEDFCFVLSYMTHIKHLKIIPYNNYHYYIGENRTCKYKMNFDTYLNHLTIQNNALNKIEVICHTEFTFIRNDIGERFFKRFVNYIKDTKKIDAYKNQVKTYCKNISTIESQNLEPFSKRSFLLKKIFKLPYIISFYFTQIIFHLNHD